MLLRCVDLNHVDLRCYFSQFETMRHHAPPHQSIPLKILGDVAQPKCKTTFYICQEPIIVEVCMINLNLTKLDFLEGFKFVCS